MPRAGEIDLAGARLMRPTIDQTYAQFGIVP